MKTACATLLALALISSPAIAGATKKMNGPAVTSRTFWRRSRYLAAFVIAARLGSKEQRMSFKDDFAPFREPAFVLLQLGMIIAISAVGVFLWWLSQ